jgi:hypothetical protein
MKEENSDRMGHLNPGKGYQFLGDSPSVDFIEIRRSILRKLLRRTQKTTIPGLNKSQE